MHEILTILVIAVALSMDTFSFSLSLGSANIELKRGISLSLIIGIMHFFMPLLGMYIGKFILQLLPFEHDFFLGIIFLIISFKMSYDIFVNHEEHINLNIIGIIIISLSVSFDAFTTGIGLLAITSKTILSTTIFMLISFLFTIIGILLGRYVNKKIGKLSTIIGIIILLFMAIYLIIW